MQLSPVVDALIRIFETDGPTERSSRGVHVSRTVSTLAFLYEKARNAVEFRAEHLVRRAAIERIIKRRIMLGEQPHSIAENLTLELMWARYIDSSLVDQKTTNAIANIIERYLAVKKQIFANSSRYLGLSWETILGIASAEIDETIVSPNKRRAFVNFVYQALRPKYDIPGISDRDITMLVYIAVERSFAQSDDALIRLHLLSVVHPDWFTATGENIAGELPSFLQNISDIQSHLTNKLVGQIGRHMKRFLPSFRLLRDFFFEEETDVRAVITDQTKFEEKLTEIASHRYREIGAKVRRAVIRSIIYIFLTKMVLALALEAPFDIFIGHKIDYIPLTINLIFPPLLLFLVAGFTAVPGAENTKRLIAQIRSIIYHFEEFLPTDAYRTGESHGKPLLTALFSLFYLLTFVISFGFIIYALTSLHFNIASQTIFIFFVALVSIFAYRIRQSAREYEVIERQGILEPLIDFFFLPILYAGDMLSKEIAKINIFIFIFDFILEAPLKVIFEVIEEWIHFIRMKKEEIL